MLHPKLQPFFQLVQYSPSFERVEILDYTSFAFTQKAPWNDNDLHLGEKLSYTCGIETWYKGPNHQQVTGIEVYIICDNTGDEEYCEGIQDFIRYIQPTNLDIKATWEKAKENYPTMNG